MYLCYLFHFLIFYCCSIQVFEKTDIRNMMNNHLNVSSKLNVGDILVYNAGIGGNTSYGFLRVTSFTKSNTPRVVPITGIRTNETSSSLLDNLECDVAPNLNSTILMDLQSPLSQNQQGFWQYKNLNRSSQLHMYDPNKVYHDVHNFM